MDLDRLRDLKRRWRAHHAEFTAIVAAWKARDYQHPPPRFPVLPDELRALPCAARTRAGTPCKRTDIELNGRCKLHGGLSTGPRTAEGIARARENLRRRWDPVRT